MSRDEFVAKHTNELTGFLLEAFMVVMNENERKVTSPGMSAARKGAFMIEQMKRARKMLEKLYTDLPGPRSESDAATEAKFIAEVEARMEAFKKDLAKPRKLEEVIADAKALSAEDRSKFRTWVEGLPKPPIANGTTKPIGVAK